MKTALAALLAAIVLSWSAAHAADTAKAERKPAAARQTQKTLKPGERFAETRKYLARQATKTAEIIKVNASKLRNAVWPDPASAKAKKQEQKAAGPQAGERAAKRD
jgi:hypothetical protein